MSLAYVSICSGIEAASAAWHSLGWNPLAFAEIEPFPSAVLKHHHPTVPNLGDMTRFHEWPELTPDVLVGGTPCQAFSVAGLRKGLADPRGNLTLVFLGLVARMRPRWVVWENVPGVLSDQTGAFGALLGGLGELGYGFAYRVLDAQYVRVDSHPWAVPQRRRRVFVVGHFGDWRRAAAVLFERESLSGNPPPRREAGQGASGTLSARTQGGGGLGTDFDLAGGVCATPSAFETAPTLFAAYGTKWNGNAGVATGQLVPTGWPAEIAPTLNAAFGEKQGLEDQHALGGAGLFVPFIAQTVAFHPTQDPISSIDGATHAMGCGSRQGTATVAVAQPVAFDTTQVRRLTPVECERLQGFPDGYTNIPWRQKAESPDGPRYKALGNSMAVNVMSWIGERINRCDSIMKTKTG